MMRVHRLYEFGVTVVTYKYELTLPASGSNKIPRFKAWAEQNAPEVEYKLPPQIPVKAATMTVRLRSLTHRDRLKATFPATLP